MNDSTLSLLKELSGLAESLETSGAWPSEQMRLLAAHGVTGWAIPREFGGSGVDSRELTIGYERLTRGCLTTTFILTQMNAAVSRIVATGTTAIQKKLLPAIAAGDLHVTVGISHLSTSRQHLSQPAVVVEQTNEGFLLDGSVPWVTGAKFADYIITGGTLGDGRQVLLALPRPTPGSSYSTLSECWRSTHPGPVPWNCRGLNCRRTHWSPGQLRMS